MDKVYYMTKMEMWYIRVGLKIVNLMVMEFKSILNKILIKERLIIEMLVKKIVVGLNMKVCLKIVKKMELVI